MASVPLLQRKIRGCSRGTSAARRSSKRARVSLYTISGHVTSRWACSAMAAAISGYDETDPGRYRSSGSRAAVGYAAGTLHDHKTTPQLVLASFCYPISLSLADDDTYYALY